MVLSFHGGGANGVITFDSNLNERRYSLFNGSLYLVCHSCDLFTWYLGYDSNFVNQENNQVADSLKRNDRSIPRSVELGRQIKKLRITFGRVSQLFS